MENTIAAALREPCPAPHEACWPDLLSAAQDHGVAPLLTRAAQRHAWPGELCAILEWSAAAEAARALLRVRELRRVLGAFARANLPVLVIKGAHVESVWYEAPGLRPRVDTDLLIRDEDRSNVRRLLAALGYEQALHVRGDVAFTQFHFVRRDDQQVLHPLDVHWRISNVRAFASRLMWSDIWPRVRALEELTPRAFAPSPSHALMIACIHRVAHHGCSQRLIWLYDIHLIAGSLDAAAREEVVRLSSERGLLEVMAVGVMAAAACFGTTLPALFVDRLRAASDADSEVRRFLAGPRRPIEIAASDWRHLRGVVARVVFLREHLFPCTDFIRRRYGVTTPLALPFLYAHRLARGAWRWF
jgi:putative nucleotidyltransferase-like protein